MMEQQTDGADMKDILVAEEKLIQKPPREAVGLALSGGGIRSATFNLGLIQALAKMGLLREIDYLSTVSGGGYIGCWLSALIHRKTNEIKSGVKPKEIVSGKESQSDPEAGKRIEREAAHKALRQIERELAGPNEPPSVSFLRSYSNYLTPRAKMFSSDSLAAAANLLRNLYLNQATLVALLIAVLITPRLLKILFDWVGSLFTGSLWILVAMVVGLLGWCVYWIHRQLRLAPHAQDEPDIVVWLVLLPGILAACVLSYVLNAAVHSSTGTDAATRLIDQPGISAFWAALGAFLYALAWLFAKLLNADHAAEGSDSPTADHKSNFAAKFIGGLAPVLAGGLGGWLFYWLAWLLNEVGPVQGKWVALSLGTALTLKIFSLMIVAHIGLVADEFTEQNHEWWGRLGGMTLMFGLVWLALFGISIYGPVTFIWSQNWMVGTGVAGWLISTASGVWLGNGEQTGHEKPNQWVDMVAQIAPHIFIAGLLVLLATGFHYATAEVADYYADTPFADIADDTLNAMNRVSPVLEFGTFSIFLATFLLLAWRVDVNLFSMNHFYRNRLSRCYLGASNPQRNPSKFTGFDPVDDEIRLADCEQRPYPIINTALNLVHGEELAWQQRKAVSFAFTPLYSGFQLPESFSDANGKPIGGFRPTREYMRGPELGTTLAISGAAASPNMGYHTSSALAFLLTLFNMRLGRWCSNPREENWKELSPTFGGGYLLRELFGLTDYRSDFVYLSDGGHFENLGIYELVRRRCHYIIASDAGQDPEITFEDLGNAIRKCYTDFGIRIDIDAVPLRPEPGARYSRQHCVVGTIHYEDADESESPGMLVYIKASLSGNEPIDILQYAAYEPTFPHQSTSDQWFDETQFESYRKLGYHIARTVFGNTSQRVPRDEAGCLDKESFFVALRHAWFPPSRASQGAFARHAETLEHLLERLSRGQNLRFLDAQICPEWKALNASLPEKEADQLKVRAGLPESHDERREGFYFCNSLIQLMECVYLDLQLEDYHDHPDNRGWMNLFKHWSWADMMQATWAISASTYGSRFQTFCEQRLDLTLGSLDVSGTLAVDDIHRPEPAEDSEPQLSRAEKANKLNNAEVSLINEITAANGAEFQIVLLRMKVRELLTFTCGFAVIDHNNLIYFRIQDHLRKMGLGRRALKQLLTTYSNITRVELCELSKDTLKELGMVENKKRFGNLFDSVLQEISNDQGVRRRRDIDTAGLYT
jgi:hypothetical protein